MPNLVYNSWFKVYRRKTTSRKLLTTNKPAFTLIELLIVITIIGILATFVIASFTSAQAKARDGRRKADLDALKKALELYRSDVGYYPNCNYNPGGTTFGNGNTCLINPDGSNFLAPPGLNMSAYMKTYPNDPLAPKYNYIYWEGGMTGGPCNGPRYMSTGGLNIALCAGYTIFACMENSNDPQAINTQSYPNPGSDCTTTKEYHIDNP